MYPLQSQIWLDLIWLATVWKLFTLEFIQKCQYYQLRVFRKKLDLWLGATLTCLNSPNSCSTGSSNDIWIIRNRLIVKKTRSCEYAVWLWLIAGSPDQNIDFPFILNTISMKYSDFPTELFDVSEEQVAPAKENLPWKYRIMHECLL